MLGPQLCRLAPSSSSVEAKHHDFQVVPRQGSQQGTDLHQGEIAHRRGDRLQLTDPAHPILFLVQLGVDQEGKHTAKASDFAVHRAGFTTCHQPLGTIGSNV
ncbi:hypothetical protein D3C73_819240 [compost metagenome]